MSKSQLIHRKRLQLPDLCDAGSTYEISFFPNEAAADNELNAFKLFCILATISETIPYYEPHENNRYRFATQVGQLWRSLELGTVSLRDSSFHAKLAGQLWGASSDVSNTAAMRVMLADGDEELADGVHNALSAYPTEFKIRVTDVRLSSSPVIPLIMMLLTQSIGTVMMMSPLQCLPPVSLVFPHLMRACFVLNAITTSVR